MADQNKTMLSIRQDFLNNRAIALDSVRSTVEKSWMRCRKMNVPVQDPPAGSARPEGMRSVSRRPALFEYLMNSAQNIFAEAELNGSVVVLTDAAGRIVHMSGKDSDCQWLRDAGITTDCSLAEEAAGTNGIGTCLYTRAKACICGAEHYKDVFLDCTTYGAPIFDEKNEICAAIGVISLAPEANPMLLCLLGHASNSMGKECSIYHLHHSILDNDNVMNHLINAMNYGIVVLDSDTCITNANSIARYFFLMYEYELIGQPIAAFISPQDLDFTLLDHDIYDQELCIHSGEIKKFTFLVSVYLTEKTAGGRNYVLVFHKPPVRAAADSSGVKQAKWRFNDIVGTSPAITEALNLAKIAAKTGCIVLITGESGVGKELIAQGIHNASDRASGPFVAVNCGAIPKSLAESELFGYENGAFTGASKSGAPGKFELADGGTIFLDEIGDMSLELQICLLRFLQEQEVTRVGGKKAKKVNVRVIAATNKNLEAAVNNSAFRLDLYYRLNVFNIHVPTLRERQSDIGNLSHYFLQKYRIRSSQPFTGFTPEALNALQNYTWPGNVRELENTIERAVIISRSERIRLDDLPEKIRSCYRHSAVEPSIPVTAPGGAASGNTAGPLISQEDMEKDAIVRALRSARGNVSKAAEIAGYSRRTMYRKLEKYNLTRK